MINLLQYYSKTEYKFCKQTSFCNFSTNNSSSDLRENVILTSFGAKIWWGILAPIRKPTHADKYLHWDSHHSISTKYSVVDTLTHRAQTVYSDQQLLGQEQIHIRTALNRCIYPALVFHRLQTKLDYQLVTRTTSLILIQTRTWTIRPKTSS